jgi:hypothetical protein
MTPEKESPTTPNGHSVASQGLSNGKSIAPTWARKRQAASLLRFQGQYLTPGELNAQVAQEAVQGRGCRPGTETASVGQGERPGLSWTRRLENAGPFLVAL